MDLTDAADKETKARQRSRKLPVVSHKAQEARHGPQGQKNLKPIPSIQRWGICATVLEYDTNWT